MNMITDRDARYIEDRLLAPATAASEAYDRLLRMSMPGEAARLMKAMQAFNDECRAVRFAVRERQQQARQGRR
jgi:hypothetical protein